jgi:hypothetical protein
MVVPTEKLKKRRGRPPKSHSTQAQASTSPASKKPRRQLTEADQRRKLQAAKDETKEQFLKVKAKVLAQTPQHLKDMYGQVCFAKFGKSWWLVLVLNPYAIPPGAVRNQWTEMFERVSERSCWLVLLDSFVEEDAFGHHLNTQPSYQPSSAERTTHWTT